MDDTISSSESESIILISNSGNRYKVNKISFQKVSAYYRALVDSGMKDAHDKELIFNSLTDECLLEVANFLSETLNKTLLKPPTTVCKQFDLTAIEMGLEGAFYFQIDDMICKYVDKLMNNINEINWLNILDIANKYNLLEVSKKVLDFVCKNLATLLDCPDILSLSADEINYIIGSDLVSADSEFDIFNIIPQWLSVDSGRQVFAENLFSNVRYNLMNAVEKKEADDILKTFNLNLNSLECFKKQRDTVAAVIALGGFTSNEFSTNRFQVLPLSDLLAVSVGNSQSSSNSVDLHYKLIPRTNKIPNVSFKSSKKHKLPQTLCEHGVCVYDGCLYVAGGQEHYCTDGRYTTNKVHVFNPVHGFWSDCSKMHIPRSLFFFSELEGHLYAVSGYTSPNTDTDTVEKYVPIEDSWVMLAPLPVKVHELAGCTNNKTLYVSGGFRGPDRGHVNLVWQFNPVNNKWYSKAPLLTARSYHSMTSVGDKLFVVGGVRYLGNDEFEDLLDGEMYDIRSDQWTLALKISKPASCMSSIVVENCLYLFGGHSFKNDEDHNFIQVINLGRYSNSNRGRDSDRNNKVVGLKKNGTHKYFIVDNDDSLAADDQTDCKILKFEARRIFYFSLCVIDLTRKYLKQFH